MRAFIEWLNEQPAGTQGLVLLLVGLVIPGVIRLTKVSVAAIKRRREQQRTLRVLREGQVAAERVAFEASPAPLGVLDHGENTTKALDELMEIAKQTVNPVSTILKTLTTRAKVLPVGVEPKRQAVAAIADELRPAVIELERLADEISRRRTMWIDAWIGVLASDEALTLEPAQLLELARVYQDGPATTFHSLSDVVRDRCRDIRRFSGKQQALTRVSERSAAAMDSIADSLRDVAAFCATGLPTHANAALVRRSAPR
ncbi:MAG: hypothetical protein U0Q11_25670 [Vicinamibacterales bacterium]